MKIQFLANPAAASGRVGRRLPALRALLERRFGRCDLEVASSWEDLRIGARRAADEGADVVVALGGDGTVNAVVNGLAETPTALAVAPLGTGSDYFRGYAAGHSWLDVLEHGRRRDVDLGELITSEGRRFFANMATAGLAADVVRRRHSVPAWVPGMLAYGIPALGAVLTLRSRALEIDVDGERLDGRYVAAFLAKGTFAGGGMRLGAGAQLDDGRLSFTAVRADGVFRSLRRFPRLYGGRFDDPLFVTRSARRVKLGAAESWPVECDGELRGDAPLEASVRCKALRLLVPCEKSHV